MRALPLLATARTGFAGHTSARWGLLTCAVLCSVSFALVLLNDTVRVLFKWLIDPVFHTTSSAATLQILAAGAIASGLLALPRGRNAEGSPTRDRSLAVILIGTLVFGHAIVLAMHVRYASAIGIPSTLHGYHWLGEQNTYSFLLHTHVGKALLAVLDPWIAALPGNYDTGLALSQRTPGAFALSVGAALLASCIAAFALLPGIARRYRDDWALTWAYFFAALNCIKTIVDGGPLTYRFLPSFLVLLLLCAARDAGHLRQLLRKFTGPCIALLAAYLALWWRVGGEDYGSAFNATLILVSALAVPVLLRWKPPRAARRHVRTVAVTALLIHAGAIYSVEAMHGTGMLLHPLPSGYRVSVLDLREPRVLVSRPVPVGTLPLDLYRYYGDDPLKPSRVFIWNENEMPQSALIAGVSYLDAGANGGRIPISSPTRVSELWRAGDGTHAILAFRADESRVPPYFSDTASALSNNNYHVHLHLAAAVLRSAGLTEFVLLPLLDRQHVERYAGRPLAANPLD